MGGVIKVTYDFHEYFDIILPFEIVGTLQHNQLIKQLKFIRKGLKLITIPRALKLRNRLNEIHVYVPINCSLDDKIFIAMINHYFGTLPF